jgi:uncharacterized Zn finger protein (UPF0148 family)
MTDCPVCFELLEENNVLSCGHNVHTECVVKSGKCICPICRADITMSDENRKLSDDIAKKMKRERDDEDTEDIFNETSESQFINDLTFMYNIQSSIEITKRYQAVKAYINFCKTLDLDTEITKINVNSSPPDSYLVKSVNCEICPGECTHPELNFFGETLFFEDPVFIIN